MRDSNAGTILDFFLILALKSQCRSTDKYRLTCKNKNQAQAKQNAPVGVSRKFFDLLGVAGAYEEAKIALHYGKLRFKDFMAPGESHENNTKTYIYRFKRYAPYFVGDPDPDKNPLLRRHDISAQVLGRIEQADVENGTHDIKILQAYLYSAGRVNSVAEMLGMHRNSVTYRLKHIEKTYDLDLGDPDERAFLNALLLLPR